MPASYIHQCIALDACTGQGAFTEEPLRFALLAGAEGPDPLFYSAWPGRGVLPAPRAARLIHTQRTDEFLLSLMGACRESALLKAYCLGFLAHYAADSICHPFIYARALTPSGAYSSRLHAQLELQLDTLHYRRCGHADGLPEHMAGFAALPGEVKDAIARALADAIRCVFPREALRPSRIRRCFDDGVALCRLRRRQSLHPSPALRMLPGVLQAHLLPLKLPAYDAANEAHAPWFSLWAPDDIRTESFFDLYQRSVSRSASLMQAARRCFDREFSYAGMRALLGGLSYASGLPWCGCSPAAKAPGARRSAAG